MSGPRTILFVHSSAGGYGADRQLALIAGGLDPARYRALVVLATYGPLVAELQAAGVETRVAPLAVLRRGELSPGGLVRIAGRLPGAARLGHRDGVALVHSNTSVTLSGAVAARRAGVPHVWHVREIYTERAWPAYRLLLRSAAALACVSAAVRAQFPPGDRRVRLLFDGLALPGGAAGPAEPAGQARPTEPAGPAQPARPAGPAGPARPTEAARPAQPARPTELADLAGPAGPARPTEAARPAQPARPTELAGLAGPAGPGRLAGPVPGRRVAGAPLVCLVLGRISSWKGQDVLLRALADVPDAVAVVAGDAWPGQEHREAALRRLAADLGVSERVRFVGFVADPRPLYAAADVVVVPSTRPDPLPNAALEAAAAGRCVLASRHGGLPEIVRDETTGLLVAPGDPLALAAALRRLAADRTLGPRLGAAAAIDVADRFAPGRLLTGVQRLYDELLSA